LGILGLITILGAIALPAVPVASFCDGQHQYTSDPYPDPAIFDNDCPLFTTDTITVSDISGAIAKVTVRFTIYHTWDADLDIYLQHPGGAQVELTTDNGGFAAAHYIDTVFDDDAALSITEGEAPFTGTFRPEGFLSDLIGLEAAGQWQLLMCDDNEEDVGYFDCWDLCIELQPTPTPTPVCLHHGDVNLDGTLTATDAQMAFYIVMGTLIPTEEQACAADCDGSGTVTSGDAQAIFMSVLGMGDGCADELNEWA